MTLWLCFSPVPIVPCLLQLLLSLGTVPLLSELRDIQTVCFREIVLRGMLLFIVEEGVII